MTCPECMVLQSLNMVEVFTRYDSFKYMSNFNPSVFLSMVTWGLGACPIQDRAYGCTPGMVHLRIRTHRHTLEVEGESATHKGAFPLHQVPNFLYFENQSTVLEGVGFPLLQKLVPVPNNITTWCGVFSAEYEHHKLCACNILHR